MTTDTDNLSLTANGGLTLASSLDANVDLFFLAGASRGRNITEVFARAFSEDPEVATRVLLWTRDVRGGAGERQIARDFLSWLIATRKDFALRVLPRIPELGRWDDVFTYFGTELETDALSLIASALHDGNGLCAKWMPRKGLNAAKIRGWMKLSPKAYRKLLVRLTNVVETAMCAQEWDEIEFGKVPSLASARYQAAFNRHAPERYAKYRAALEQGMEKINAGAVYPYDIVRSIRTGDARVANEQWKALPDYLNGSDERILPVIDVSCSMGCGINGSGYSPNGITCMDVAVSLGLYVAERLTGKFQDAYVTFHSSPTMLKATGTLSSRVKTTMRAPWGGSTNIKAVFELILKMAIQYKVAEEDMPTKVLILSDMEFDHCVSVGGSRGLYYSTESKSAILTTMDSIREQFEQAGYEMPQIVFWNLNGRAGNVPVRYDESGAALVSGFSPAIMKSLLGGEDFTPRGVLLKTVLDSRYDF